MQSIDNSLLLNNALRAFDASIKLECPSPLQIFGFLAVMCSILAVGNAIWEVREGSVFIAFLPRPNGVNAGFSAFLTFWSYVIILNTVVPISLYVRLVQKPPGGGQYNYFILISV